jgi:UDP-N-acetylglucosamine 1-carboxyvinyltransferase
MDRFHIVGPTPLRGKVRASGAKNAALPALAATLLTDETVVLHRVPRVRDIRTMRRLLAHLGMGSEDRDGGEIVLARQSADGSAEDAPYDLVKTMRASVLVLGPQLAKRGFARVSLPGGCAIGVRPIDQHLRGLTALGADVQISHGYVEARARRLVGARFRFDMPTVTGTENVLMAATLARGTTVLENCAREPEVVDLAELLVAMGARIFGAGEETITIEGVEGLGNARHVIIPDRIEGGTYLIGAALTGGDVLLEEARAADLAPLLEKLAETGVDVEVTVDGIRTRSNGALRSRDCDTAPHPRFPTDLQAQYMALMTQAEGVATIREPLPARAGAGANGCRRAGRRRHRAGARAPDALRSAGDGDRSPGLGLSGPRRLRGRRGDGRRPHLPPRSRVRGNGTEIAGPGSAGDTAGGRTGGLTAGCKPVSPLNLPRAGRA